PRSRSVVVAALRDFELRGIAFDPVDQAVLAGDPARPPSPPFVSQRLGLADALERARLDIGDQGVDASDGRRIGLLPLLIILQRLRGPADPHAVGSKSVSLPASASSIARVSRSRLRGERTRCSVSMMLANSASASTTTARAPWRVTCSSVRSSVT